MEQSPDEHLTAHAVPKVACQTAGKNSRGDRVIPERLRVKCAFRSFLERAYKRDADDDFLERVIPQYDDGKIDC